MPSIEIYAELLSNIRTISFVGTLHTDHNEETRIELSADGSQICIQHEGKIATINLPVRMTGGGTAALVLPPVPTRDITLRLTLQEKAPGFLKFQGGNENITPWPASSFNDASINCKHCSSVCLESNRITDWRDLPSEDWADMMDFWHCHKPHDESHEHDHEQASHSKGYGSSNRLQAVVGVGFVGLSNILLSPQDCQNLNVRRPALHRPLRIFE